jgi:hypothetical protein
MDEIKDPQNEQSRDCVFNLSHIQEEIFVASFNFAVQTLHPYVSR